MGYKIYFFGLVNFFDLKPEGRLLLLPDGRAASSAGIPRHDAFFVLEKKRVVRCDDWWPGSDGEGLEEFGLIAFPIVCPSKILISGLYDQPGASGCWPFGKSDKLNAQKHAYLLPRLKEIDPDFNIVPSKATTIAQLPVRRGKLEAFRLKLRIQPKYHAAISRLTLKRHSGPITITALTDDGVQVKTLTIEEGTDLALTNASQAPIFEECPEPARFDLASGATDSAKSHFRIYAQLDEYHKDDKLDEPKLHDDLREVERKHPYIKYLLKRFEQLPGAGCSNTGCCQK